MSRSSQATSGWSGNLDTTWRAAACAWASAVTPVAPVTDRSTRSSDFLAHPDLDPGRGSFTVAVATARDQLTAAGIITDTTIDLVGVIGRAVLGDR